jgi:CRISPR-associated protein Csm1
MTMPSELLLWAGLLHDVGKLGQRGDKPLDSGGLADHIKNNRTNICPYNGQYHSHLHVLWTQQALETKSEGWNASSLVEQLENRLLGKQPDTEDNLTNLAVKHHKPASFLQGLVQMADHWASGLEREKSADYKPAAGEAPAFRTRGLVPVFETLNIPLNENDISEGNANGVHEYPIGVLELNRERLMPVQANGNDKTPEYAKLWESFLKGLSSLRTNSSSVFTEELLALMKSHLWCVPASTNDFPYVSLYEHCKITGAIAHCLHRYWQENPDSMNDNAMKGKVVLAEEHHPLLLFCADLSGIQKFLYDTGSTKAAKSLKGRSFGLQLLIEGVMRELMERTRCSLAHVVYQSGGKFYAILPNTTEVVGILIAFQEEMQEAIWDKYEDQLYISMGWQGFAYQKTDKDNAELRISLEGKTGQHELRDLWMQVARNTSAVKSRKWDYLAKNQFSKLFEPSPAHVKANENLLACAVTGSLLTGDNQAILNDDKGDEEEEPLLVSKLVKSQMLLGKHLANAKAIVWNKKGEGQSPEGHMHPVLKNLKFTAWVVSNLNQPFGEGCRLSLLNGNFTLSREISGNGASGFSFYGGNEHAMNPETGKPKTYDELAEGDGEGFDRLGILRMDVDNLGSVFSRGMRFQSFSGYATLSGSLDLFFSGYLNRIREEYQNDSIILYSGGDDVFVLGHWEKVLDMAQKIREEFRAFSGRRELGLSGGMVLVGGKYPIAKSAAMAGEEEDIAKAHVADKRQKDAFSVFGTAFRWETEWQIAYQEVLPFLMLHMENGNFSMNLIQKLFYFLGQQTGRFYNEMGNEKKNWLWQSAYTFKRAKGKNGKTDKNDAIDVLYKFFLSREFKNVKFDAKQFEALLRIAQLLNRKNNNKFHE